MAQSAKCLPNKALGLHLQCPYKRSDIGVQACHPSLGVVETGRAQKFIDQPA